MSNRYLIIIVAFWLCFPVVPCKGAGSEKFSDDFIGLPVQNVISTQDPQVSFAKKEETKTSGNTADNSAVKADEDGTEPQTSTKDKKAPKNTKPLKPFVPSETVPADQGVDFPYDI